MTVRRQFANLPSVGCARAGVRICAASRSAFRILRTPSIPASMYAALREARISFPFFVGIYRKPLCFGRFPRQFIFSNALHQFANRVRPLTALVCSSQISRRSLICPQIMKPVVIRMLCRHRVRARRVFDVALSAIEAATGLFTRSQARRWVNTFRRKRCTSAE